jgi:outer membrane protein
MVVCFLGTWLGAAWPASPVKIGYIDLQQIIEKSEKGKEFRDKVFQLRKEKEKILSTKQEEVTKMRQDYQQKSLTLSDRARLDKEQEIRQKELEFQNLSESYRQEVLLEGRKLQTLMFKDLSDVVRQIGQKEGFTMIVDKDATLYVSESIDITEKVIQQYNAQSKKAGK